MYPKVLLGGARPNPSRSHSDSFILHPLSECCWAVTLCRPHAGPRGSRQEPAPQSGSLTRGQRTLEGTSGKASPGGRCFQGPAAWGLHRVGQPELGCQGRSQVCRKRRAGHPGPGCPGRGLQKGAGPLSWDDRGPWKTCRQVGGCWLPGGVGGSMSTVRKERSLRRAGRGERSRDCTPGSRQNEGPRAL